MISAIPLKPCPFCGESAELIEQNFSAYGPTYHVQCSGCTCGVQGKQGDFLDGNTKTEQVEAAVRNWNNRA